MKYKRQSKITDIIKNTEVHTHDELIGLLRKEGFTVTQATVSRDIKELGLIKVPAAGGAVYAVPPGGDENAAKINMIADSVRTVTSALHTVVISTYPGMASAVAAAVDGVMKNDMLGSVAGDDTVLIITESEAKAAELEAKMNNAFKKEW